MQIAQTFLGSEASSRTRMPLRILALAVTRKATRQPSHLTSMKEHAYYKPSGRDCFDVLLEVQSRLLY